MKKSEVKIWQPKNTTGWFIEVKDKHTENRLAITHEELELIVLYGQS